MSLNNAYLVYLITCSKYSSFLLLMVFKTLKHFFSIISSTSLLVALSLHASLQMPLCSSSLTSLLVKKLLVFINDDPAVGTNVFILVLWSSNCSRLVPRYLQDMTLSMEVLATVRSTLGLGTLVITIHLVFLSIIFRP